MRYPCICAETEVLSSRLFGCCRPILRYRIRYPCFDSQDCQLTIKQINRFYCKEAQAFQHHCESELYPMALQQCQTAMAEGWPVMEFEAQGIFSVTYNQKGLLSLYRDEYVFTGGAHGSTVRAAETWDVCRGAQMPLEAFFSEGFDYKAFCIQQVIAQIEQQDESLYFPNYPELVEQTFNPASFYLGSNGLVLFFQQYDIAPYAYGIPEFVLPWEDGTATTPNTNEENA